MPVNKNAMTRYKILDELLSSRYHNYSLDDLTEEVSNRLAELDPNTNGVVRRTIEKDISYSIPASDVSWREALHLSEDPAEVCLILETGHRSYLTYGGSRLKQQL